MRLQPCVAFFHLYFVYLCKKAALLRVQLSLRLQKRQHFVTISQFSASCTWNTVSIQIIKGRKKRTVKKYFLIPNKFCVCLWLSSFWLFSTLNVCTLNINVSVCALLPFSLLLTHYLLHSLEEDVSLNCHTVLRGKCFTATQTSHWMMPIPSAITSQMSAVLILMLSMQLALFLCRVSIGGAFPWVRLCRLDLAAE